MIFRNCLVGLGALTLSACGAGSGQFTVEPLSAAGFAEEGKGFVGPYDFAIQDVPRIFGDSAALAQDGADEIRIVGVAGEGPITVTIEGETYTLERAPLNDGPARFEDGADTVLMGGIIPDYDYVEITGIQTFVDGQLAEYAFARGFDTHPDVVGDQSGTAAFRGEIRGRILLGFGAANGSGDATMSINFDAGTISGSGRIEDDLSASASFTFAPIVVALEETDIVENSFSGNLNIQSDIDGVFEDGDYSGRFFDPDAQTVAGQFSARIDLTQNDDDAFLIGGFIATE